MRLNMYSIYDRASGVYDRPWCAHSDEMAMRMFGDQATGADTYIGKHPEDFTLFRVGTWDDNKGQIVGEAPEKVVNGVEIVAATQKVNGEAHKELNEKLEAVN
jgi:hypothetical protein